MSRLRMAVIGVGHLGKEHARILAGLPEVELIGVADTNAEQAQNVARRNNTHSFTDYWPLLNLVDAASIAVPTTHHLSVAAEFLRRGISVLVEKPLALNSAQAEALVQLGQKNNALLQVGHIERFNPAFEALAQTPLRPKFITCERIGPFTGRSMDIGVVLDLMIHDLDLILALVHAPVLNVEAMGVSLFGEHEDLATARVRFADGCVADLHASRASPEPQRRMQVWGPEGYAGLDFQQRTLTLVQPSEHLRRHGLSSADLDPARRARLKDELFRQHLQVAKINGHGQDQLTCELKHFVQCVQTRATPRVSGTDGQAALLLADAILESIRNHSWQANAHGPRGARHLPVTKGPLFQPLRREEAA